MQSAYDEEINYTMGIPSSFTESGTYIYSKGV